MSKKVVILQNIVPHYRKAVYNKLGEQFDTTILHSGNATVTPEDNYKEIIIKAHQIGRFFIQKRVNKAIKKNNFDVIIAMFDLAWISYITLNFKYPKQVIYWGHRYSKNYLANKFRNFIMRRCGGVILYSEVEVKEMIDSGVDKNKIFIAHNTMLISNHEDTSKAEKDCFIFVGRAQKRKKVDMLIRSFSEIVDTLPSNVNLYIIGAGKENKMLKKLVSNLEVDSRVIFTGAIHDDNLLKEYFKRAYAYVSPGPVGLGVLHSFAYGVPVVTLKEGKHGPEFQNIINRQNGVIFEKELELKSILQELVENGKLASNLGHNAYKQYKEERNLQIMVDGIIKSVNSIN